MFAAFVLLGVLGVWPAAWAARPTVAVFDFQVGNSVQVHIQKQTRGSNGRGNTLSIKRSRQSNLITNRLVNALVHSGKVIVIERQKVRKLIDEGRFNQSGLVGSAHAEKLGKMLGADYLIFGSITSLDSRVETEQLPYNAGQERKAIVEVGANARMVDTQTGAIVASTQKLVQKKKSGTDTSGTHRLLTHQFEGQAVNQLAREMADDLLRQSQSR